MFCLGVYNHHDCIWHPHPHRRDIAIADYLPRHSRLEQPSLSPLSFHMPFFLRFSRRNSSSRRSLPHASLSSVSLHNINPLPHFVVVDNGLAKCWCAALVDPSRVLQRKAFLRENDASSISEQCNNKHALKG